MKTIKIILLSIILCLAIFPLRAQQAKGVVYHLTEHSGDGHGHEIHTHKTPLPGANVYWAGTQSGTFTGPEGRFVLELPDGVDPKLVVSFVGYMNDTIRAGSEGSLLEITLSASHHLDELVVSEKAPGTFISRLDPVYTQNISGAELHRAACCNLSESFETNASVDASYSDAVTGAKQIQLLGLRGTYSQIMTENIPNLRGLATSYGLGYIPGSWMESIQISKGTAAVVNGFESIAGQINVEYLKPDQADRLFLNAYGNSHGKIEGNAITAHKLSERWSTAVFAHAENLSHKLDDNGDGFLDMPLGRQFNVFNRWKYEKQDKLITQFGFKVLDEERNGGQMDFSPGMKRDTLHPYGTGINTRRYEAFWKGGYVFENRPSTSIGMLQSFTHHRQNSFFGLNDYDARENSYYLNLIFQSYIRDTRHNFSTGLSLEMNDFKETLNDSIFNRYERIPGLFFQYTFIPGERFTIIAGIRGDHHNLFGAFITPRFHVKYMPAEHTVLRASAGMGYRTANIIAENNSILATSRNIFILEEPRQERAVNAGINITQYVDILGKELRVSAEAYHTRFLNQVILDFDRSPRSVYIYNLNGESYSTALQIEAAWEVVRRLDALVAFRYNDVQMTTDDQLQFKPLLHRYKGLLTLSYATNLKKWQFDLTGQFNGPGRIPTTEGNPEEYRRNETSPAYTIINAQVSRYFKKWNIYLGGENLTGYKQKDPIIAADQPFSEYFDASLIWGPLSGVNIYAGIRFTL